MDPTDASGAIERVFAALGDAAVRRGNVRRQIRQLSVLQLADAIDMLTEARDLAVRELQTRGDDAAA